ncbi:hypothetical protein N7535_007389 [Penicillium sp. DV-2018c]|nr:hypothetical protein N7535_007389 [Penicillium sp. DV-2018c]
MSRYDDYRSSTGTLDSRDRHDRYSRGPPVVDRPRRAEERFEDRFREEERYGPPARAPGRIYQDDHLDYPSTVGSFVAHDRRRHRDDSPSFRRPQLLRRQSSLDTFDRIPQRKMERLERDLGPRAPRAPRAPVPPSRHQFSPGRYREREVYEDIRIAEPDYYGDEEFRGIRERDMVDRRRRSSSTVRRHHEEKPYPRKGRTRIPRHLAHVHAILDLGYPFKEEDDVIVIQKALSKEQIDEVLSLSREFRRPSPVQTEYLELPASPPRRPRERAPSPRTSHEAFIVEASPSRHRSRSRHRLDYDDYEDYYEITERPRVRAVSRGPQRRRAVSVNDHGGRLAPVQYIEHRETDHSRAGPVVLVRPRDSDDLSDYVRQLEEETQRLRLERQQGGIEITRERDWDIIDSNGNEEEVTEVRKQERSEPNSRLVRAMMATLT